MTHTPTPTAYGRRMTFKWGIVEVEAKHAEWLSEAERRLNAHDELVAALRKIAMAGDPDDEFGPAAVAAAALAKVKPAKVTA